MANLWNINNSGTGGTNIRTEKAVRHYGTNTNSAAEAQMPVSPKRKSEYRPTAKISGYWVNNR